MENKSIWELTTSIDSRQELEKDINCSILIVGAGLAGILCGYLLSKDNNDVVIIDKDKIASGASKNTTAKITAQQSLIYHKLLKTIGYEKTKLFYKANIEAFNQYLKIIKDENIDCDFAFKDSYVYSLRDTNKLKKEYRAYKKLNIDGNLTDDSDLPFSINQALVMKNQAQFNPLKFIKEISKNLTIYENTKMVKLDNQTIITDKGYKINANKIIIATHFPIIDIYGYYFMKEYQSKSYLLALKGVKPVNGIYIDENKHGLTLRDYNDYLLFGGYSSRTGKNSDKYYFDKLEKEANKYFRDFEIVSKFSAQDCMSLDSIPYIGRYGKKTNNIYVATGFNKWGMIGAMISALVIKDLINNRENKYQNLFSPSRLNLINSIGNISKNSLSTINNLFIKRIIMKRKKVIDLKKGESIITKYKKKYIGVYKDLNDNLHIVDVRCPHLGCILSFNKEEKVYECPCHGSKFDYDGNLIYSPSIRNLKDAKL